MESVIRGIILIVILVILPACRGVEEASHTAEVVSPKSKFDVRTVKANEDSLVIFVSDAEAGTGYERKYQIGRHINGDHIPVITRTLLELNGVTGVNISLNAVYLKGLFKNSENSVWATDDKVSHIFGEYFEVDQRHLVY